MKLLPGLALLVLAGCGTTVPTTNTIKTDDPIDSFRRHVSKGTERAEAKGWSIGNASMDVRKTDSLISPHEGILSFHAARKSVSEKTRGQDEYNFKFRFSNSDGKWQLASAQYEIINISVWHKFSRVGNLTEDGTVNTIANCFD